VRETPNLPEKASAKVASLPPVRSSSMGAAKEKGSTRQSFRRVVDYRTSINQTIQSIMIGEKQTNLHRADYPFFTDQIDRSIASGLAIFSSSPFAIPIYVFLHFPRLLPRPFSFQYSAYSCSCGTCPICTFPRRYQFPIVAFVWYLLC
jgi:hypothetical protein